MTSGKNKPIINLLNDYHLLSFDTLDSTNEEAKRIAKSGSGHGAVIWAKKQTAGKGRMGRSWASQEGNLFVSVLLKPEKPVHEFSQLSFVAAVAVHQTLKDVLPKEYKLACKWPNDLLVDDRKVGGILLESFKSGEENSHWVVVGVGVNVDNFPEEAEFPATCLTDNGVELVSAKIVLSRFIHHFIECYDEWNANGFEPIRRHWLKVAWGMGQKLVARLPDKEIEGVAYGIDPHGNLILELGGGRRQFIQAADVYPVEEEV